MPAPRDFIDGPWRAVPVLGVTQILSWGSIFYTPVLIVPLIAAERGWSMSFAMGGFSVGLLAAGLSAPYVGRSIDRFGGHVVMTVGSLIGALGLVLIAQAAGRLAYLAVWVVLGVAMAANLYDSAFAHARPHLRRRRARADHRADARRRLRLDRELAGDAFSDRRGRLARHLPGLCRAARLHLGAAACAWRCRAARVRAGCKSGERRAAAAGQLLPPYGLPFILVATAFATYAFVPSGLSAHLLAIFARSGIDAGTVVWIGALFGPAQVGARLIEFAFGRNLHPLWVARFALSVLLCAFTMLALLGISVPVAAAFALMFGGANGLVTITRGAVPLALFGASGYGRLMGRLAGPFLLVQAAAPLVMAFVRRPRLGSGGAGAGRRLCGDRAGLLRADQATGLARTGRRCPAGWCGRNRRRAAVR